MKLTRKQRLAVMSIAATVWGISVANGYRDENVTRLLQAFLAGIFPTWAMRSWWAVLLVPPMFAIGIILDETLLHQGVSITTSTAALAVLYATYGTVVTMTILHIHDNRRKPTHTDTFRDS